MANQTFNLRNSSVVSLNIPHTVGVPVHTPLTINGETYTLAMDVHSVRSPFYEVKVQVAGGQYVPGEAAPVNTLHGQIAEVPGSVAAGAMMDDGLYATMHFPNGDRYWLEPMVGRVPGAVEGQYVLYNGLDVIPSGGTCGVKGDQHPLAAEGPVDVQGGIAADGADVCVDLGVDTDVEYFNHYGSTTAVQNRINLVVSTMNVQYETQVDIQHVITTIIVRTAEPDPYSSTNPDTLLNQFINEWNANQTSIIHDVAQMYSGKEWDGSVIGLAPLSSVCTSSGYCIVQSDCCGSLSCSTDLSAHELGHTWSAVHCNCPGETMNPSITCANFFGAATVNDIVNFRNTRTCIAP
ncbi:MAG TPA: M12 family metallo-peptidase, partial [Phycisphaerales bacterium]|nr:M12 family metallo-peptidase [Phycisphaerales bacterium]